VHFLAAGSGLAHFDANQGVGIDRIGVLFQNRQVSEPAEFQRANWSAMPI